MGFCGLGIPSGVIKHGWKSLKEMNIYCIAEGIHRTFAGRLMTAGLQW